MIAPRSRAEIGPDTMPKRFRLRDGAWRRGADRTWWRKYPAWAIIALLIVLFLLWTAFRKYT